MKAVTAEEMRRIDGGAIEQYGVPGAVLMGWAARVAANYVLDNFPGPGSAAVFCGCGNNGGDGFAIAYLLHNRGWRVSVYLAGDAGKISETARTYFEMCVKSRIEIVPSNGEGVSSIDIASADIIVDALLGTGFVGALRGPAADAVALINRSGKTVISVDVPSGLPSDGAGPDGEAVRADVTVTMGLPKISLVTYPGKRWTGKLVLADIGFPLELTASPELTTEMIDLEYASSRFPGPGDADAHKGSVGHALMIGGFEGMEGALLLAASACFQAGIGLVSALTTHGSRSVIAGKLPELMTAAIPGTGSEDIPAESVADSVSRGLGAFFGEGRPAAVTLIGPGMGRGPLSRAVFRAIIENRRLYGLERIIIDGDGLFHFAEWLAEGGAADGDLIITPHFLEASRITSVHVEEMKGNRFAAVKSLAKKSSAVSLLKGPATLVSDGENTRINTTGNPALATAGSGDVLAGIISSLACRGLPSLDAAALGAWLHGRAADLFVAETGYAAMKASDIIAYIPKAVSEIAGTGRSC